MINSTQIRVRLGALLVTGLALAACGGNQVGSKDLTNFNDQKSPHSLTDLPSPSPTPVLAAAPAQAPAPQQATAPKPAPAAPAPVQKSTPPAAANRFAISINSDESGNPPFQPSDAQFPRGTVVTWTNHDTQPRSFATDQGAPAAISSPMIQQNGGTFSYTVTVPGTYRYHDQAKVYDLGTFQAS